MYVFFTQHMYIWYMLFLLLRNASKLEICIEVGELEPQEAGESVWTRHIECESQGTTCANRMQQNRDTFSVALATKLISFSDDFLAKLIGYAGFRGTLFLDVVIWITNSAADLFSFF